MSEQPPPQPRVIRIEDQRWEVTLPNRVLHRRRIKHYDTGTVGDEAASFAQALAQVGWDRDDKAFANLEAIATMLNGREQMIDLLGELLDSWPQDHRPDLRERINDALDAAAPSRE